MKATVWTKWNPKERDHQKSKPKCIFNGEIDVLPHKGDWLAVRDGFGSVLVYDVTIDLVEREVEISVDMVDYDNEYGPCLFK